MSDQIRQCDAGHLSLGAGNWECPWCKVAKAEAEVKPRDACQFCLGAKGGVPGNENRFGDVVACDHCSALLARVRFGWEGEK